jgi:uncharacterized membrane protein YwaF
MDGAYMLVTRSYVVYEFAYFMGIASAIQALLTPDLGLYGFPTFASSKPSSHMAASSWQPST